MVNALVKFSLAPLLLAASTAALASQLSTNAMSAVPHDVQQLVAIDYQAMENSAAAMALRNRVMPPALKQLETALEKSGLNDNNDVDEMAFGLFRGSGSGDSLYTVGIAEGEFSEPDILANFNRLKIKPTMLRANSIYPMTRSGMVLCFMDPSTIVFGDKDAVEQALNAHDGFAPSMLTNGPMMSAMQSVSSAPLWSILDSHGTRTMMNSLLGQAGSVTNYKAVRDRLQSCWYSMNFQNGVQFSLTISTGDAFTAATISSLLSAAMIVRKMTSTPAEAQALNATSVSSNMGQITIHFASSDSQFSSLLESPLFQSVVH